jgi:hypothetical protein
MSRYPPRQLTKPQRLSWRRLFCLHTNWLRHRDDAGQSWRICDHCGATIPGWDVTPKAEKEER